MQHRALRGQLVFGAGKARRRVEHLVLDAGQLRVECAHGARGGVSLQREIALLLRQIVHRALQLLHAPLQRRPFAANALELRALSGDALRRRHRLRPGGAWLYAQQQDRDAQGPAHHDTHTRLSCRPTDTALPTNPITAPIRMPSSSTGVGKN